MQSSVTNGLTCTLSQPVPKLVFIPSLINNVRLHTRNTVVEEEQEHLNNETCIEHKEDWYELESNHFNKLPDKICEMVLPFIGKSSKHSKQ